MPLFYIEEELKDGSESTFFVRAKNKKQAKKFVLADVFHRKNSKVTMCEKLELKGHGVLISSNIRSIE